MKRMRWTWDELEACPAYVRNYVIDFLQMEDERNAKAQPRGEVIERDPGAWGRTHDG